MTPSINITDTEAGLKPSIWVRWNNFGQLGHPSDSIFDEGRRQFSHSDYENYFVDNVDFEKCRDW